jgi:steroid delta-isomerase-like uncharacterized protein
MSLEANKAVVQAWINARNQNDIEAAVALFVEEWQTRLRQGFASITNSFPDVQITINELIAEDDKVVSLWTFRGTHLGTYQTIPATGKVIEWHGIDIYTIREGRIANVVRHADSLSVLRQLGAEVTAHDRVIL